MIAGISRLAPFQHAFVERLSELGIAYPDSPIVEGAGKRYFDDSLCGGDGHSQPLPAACRSGRRRVIAGRSPAAPDSVKGRPILFPRLNDAIPPCHAERARTIPRSGIVRANRT